LALLAGVAGTLSKTKELGKGTIAGVINYTNVSAGLSISTYTLTGYINGVQDVRIKRGATNTFAQASGAGVMTAQIEEAITTRIDAFIVAEEAKRVAKAAKEKIRRDAKAAKAKL
jgi:hypothetical protein